MKVIQAFSRYLSFVSAIFLLVLCIITMGDIIGRNLISPLPGAQELSELALATLIFLGLAYTQAEKGHIAIDVFFVLFPRQLQIIVEKFTLFLALFVSVLLSWAGLNYALDSIVVRAATDTLGVAKWPFILAIFVGGVALCLQLIIDILHRQSS